MANKLTIDGTLDLQEFYDFHGAVDFHFGIAERSDDGQPFLSIRMSLPGEGDLSAYGYIDGLRDIDALRRYCEMVLEHFKSRAPD